MYTVIDLTQPTEAEIDAELARGRAESERTLAAIDAARAVEALLAARRAVAQTQADLLDAELVRTRSLRETLSAPAPLPVDADDVDELLFQAVEHFAPRSTGPADAASRAADLAEAAAAALVAGAARMRATVTAMTPAERVA